MAGAVLMNDLPLPPGDVRVVTAEPWQTENYWIIRWKNDVESNVFMMQRSYLHVDLLCEVGDSTPSEGSTV